MFKVVGPMWAQATVGDNAFVRLVKTGKKVLRKVLQQKQPQREVPKPTWSLRSHAVKVDESTQSSRRLIGGLFPKHVLKTQAAECRRQAALRLVRDAKKVPVFAFVGLSMGLGGTSVVQKEGGSGSTEDVWCSGIRELFQQFGGKESLVEKGGQQFSLQSLHLGALIGQGCNAAVFKAKPADTVHADDQGSSVDQVPEPADTEAEPSSDGSDLNENNNNLPSLATGTTDDEDKDDIDDDDEDDISIISEDDDDFSILDEEEEETDGETEERLDDWVLLRLSSVPVPDSDEVADDSDSDDDIIILARDEDDNLESLPDFEALDSDFSWSSMSEAGTEGGIQLDSTGTESDGPATDTTSASLDCTLSSENHDSSSVTTEDLEPAPNLSLHHEEGNQEFPLAVKMMFNYNVESKADHIINAMAKETVPALSRLTHVPQWEHSSLSATKRLPPHPNIITMYDVFVDQTPDLPEGKTKYPCALPPRLNEKDGWGRNKTMFLVMKKYTMTLNEFLQTHPIDIRTRCLLFAQLLEGVAHMSAHEIAHRDLKSDNVLVDLSNGTDCPHLVISDFGSCLADVHYGLRLPYLTCDTDKGGNSALMAPEIKCAVPGPGCILDYSRADVWAVGTLAYEIFGEGNPFYNGLDSRVYCEEDLPMLPGDTPEVVVKLAESMLKRNPSERPSPAVAATCLELFLWAPPQLSPFTQQRQSHSGCRNAIWRFKEISHWLESLTMETVCQRVFGGRASWLDLQMKSVFLSRVSRQDIFGVVSFEG